MHHPILIQSPADIDPALQRLQTRKREIEARRLTLEGILGQVDHASPKMSNLLEVAIKCLIKRAEWEATDFIEMEKALQEQIDGLLRMKFGPGVVRQ